MRDKMVSKIKVNEVVVVEGKYDKIRLESLIDGLIIPTDGFGIFKRPEKQAMLRQLAGRRGLLILTDSDSAGFMIRNFLRGIVPKERIKHAYIPDILGKERRKPTPSREGKIGVEGMETGILLDALRAAGVGVQPPRPQDKITKMMLFEDGLSGGQDSRARRRRLLAQLNLPENMTANAMLEALNALLTAEEYHKLIECLSDDL
ncbi:MAG: DUF4093 domain-containing protein [Oscillospiraceae bacterium]|nr:DUF4093 domain-containing protein [Oscillospiraceae bacterium]